MAQELGMELTLGLMAINMLEILKTVESMEEEHIQEKMEINI